jgi:hypothetical protein
MLNCLLFRSDGRGEMTKSGRESAGGGHWEEVRSVSLSQSLGVMNEYKLVRGERERKQSQL